MVKRKSVECDLVAFDEHALQSQLRVEHDDVGAGVGLQAAALVQAQVIGLDLADASHRLSLYPADYLGLHERGRLQPDACADIVVLDAQLRLQRVFVEGDEIALD